MLRAGEDIPDWFAFPQVVQVLRAHVAASKVASSEDAPNTAAAAPGPAPSSTADAVPVKQQGQTVSSALHVPAPAVGDSDASVASRLRQERKLAFAG